MRSARVADVARRCFTIEASRAPHALSWTARPKSLRYKRFSVCLARPLAGAAASKGDTLHRHDASARVGGRGSAAAGQGFACDAKKSQMTLVASSADPGASPIGVPRFPPGQACPPAVIAYRTTSTPGGQS